MAQSTWKAQVLEGLRAAVEEFPVTRIARDTDIPRQRLYDFLSKGYLATDDVKKVADWLYEHGHLREPKKGRELEVVRDPLDRATYLLENLCSELRDDRVKRQAKIELMNSTLRYVLDEVVPQIEKKAKRK